MLIDLYVLGDSPVHRAPPGLKIAALVTLCSAVFLIDDWLVIAGTGAVVASGYASAGLGLRHAAAVLRPAFWILAAICAVQWFLTDALFAGFVGARFAVLILAASLVTMTTPTSAFVTAIENGLDRLPARLPSRKIALAIGLCLRFIPLIATILKEVRLAQRARGLERHPTALLVPLVVRTLKTADEVSQAIYARSVDEPFAPEPARTVSSSQTSDGV